MVNKLFIISNSLPCADLHKDPENEYHSIKQCYTVKGHINFLRARNKEILYIQIG